MSKRTAFRCIVPVVVIFLCTAACVHAQVNLLTPDRIGREEYERYGIAEKVKKGDFKRYEIGDMLIYFDQRTIGGAIVEGDFINYQFDRETGELLKSKIRWRDGLPEQLPQALFAREDAAFFADLDAGDEMLFSGLYIISPDSAVFPLDPPPENPCWVVSGRADGVLTTSVIDAMTGEFLGFGIPPPDSSFSFTGPTSPCSGGWYGWYQNARDWFNTMGYPCDAMTWPTGAEVQSHVQDPSVALFYELAHGGSTSFASGCDGGYTYTYATYIESWIADYPKMPFAFIGSCEGLCNTGDNTFSYEFRKGSSQDTATVGYCHMAGSNCSTYCWYAGYTIAWQDTLFDYMNQGWTVKAAFDQANADYPGCSSYSCMRFAGDEDFAGPYYRSDTDGDGLKDDYELSIGTDPADADTDDDDLSDYEEVGYDGDYGDYDPYDPVANPAGTDTDANDADTDGGGEGDAVEIEDGRDPLDADDDDSDGDGLTNAAEDAIGTDRNDPDSDGDGYTDYEEVGHDGDYGDYDPYDPVANPTGTDTDANDADSDNDGYNDMVEIAGGSDPLLSGWTAAELGILINFQPPGSARPGEFAVDVGEPYSVDVGYGW